MRCALLLLCGLAPTAGCRATAPLPEGSSDEIRAPGATLRPAVPRRALAQLLNAHCGGARITPETQRALNRPAAGLAFLVLPGDRNTSAEPVARFTTDNDGLFDVPELPAGTWCVVRAERALSAEQEAALLALPPPAPQPPRDPREMYVDPDCLARLPLQCEAVWKNDGGPFSADLWLPGRRCPWSQPCTSYAGPMPP